MTQLWGLVWGELLRWQPLPLIDFRRTCLRQEFEDLDGLWRRAPVYSIVWRSRDNVLLILVCGAGGVVLKCCTRSLRRKRKYLARWNHAISGRIVLQL